MQHLFLSRENASNLGEVKTIDCFSNGLPVSCSFVNGFYCKICKKVTEHRADHTCQECQPLKLVNPKKIIRRRQDLGFWKIVRAAVCQAELDVFVPIVRSNYRVLSPYNYGVFRMHIFRSKKFEVNQRMKKISLEKKRIIVNGFSDVRTRELSSNVLDALEACKL